MKQYFMKKNIHPPLQKVTFICSCGATFELFSSIKEQKVKIEICAKCHPFYTGEHKIVKTGSVERYLERLKKTEKLKGKQA